MNLGMGTFGFITVLSFFSIACEATEVADSLDLQYKKYANDSYPTLYINDKFVYTNGNFLGQLNLYTETGPIGSWSFDPDPIRFSFRPDANNTTMLWIGREHPLNFTRDYSVDPYGALGSIWAQNQTEALNPRVSGWIGVGFTQETSQNWKIIGMYSPFFLPTFGPSLGFSDNGELNPQRFTRLPPANAETSGVTVPIRYDLELSRISQIVLQPQAFVGTNFNNSNINFDVYAYTAPDPNAVATTDAKLAVNNVTANANVTVQAQFPREYWSGTRVSLKNVPFTPAFEFVQNLVDYPTHIVSLTGYIDTPQFNPFVAKRTSKSTFGILSHFQRDFSDPNLSDFLIFVKIPVNITDALAWNTLLQTTMLSMRQSFYWFNEFEYTIQKNFSLTADLRILSGQDHSYYGDWRDEDSFSFGVRREW
jgi:hypothetical protein